MIVDEGLSWRGTSLLLVVVLLRKFVERKVRIKYTKCAKSAVKRSCLQRIVRWPQFSRQAVPDNWSIDSEASLSIGLVSLRSRKVELAGRGGSQMGPMLVCSMMPGKMEPSRECTCIPWQMFWTLFFVELAASAIHVEPGSCHVITSPSVTWWAYYNLLRISYENLTYEPTYWESLFTIIVKKLWQTLAHMRVCVIFALRCAVCFRY